MLFCCSGQGGFRASRHYDLFRLLFLTHFAQVFGPIKAIKKENTIQMVNLMLEDAGKPTLSRNTDLLPMYILSLDENFCGTTDIVTNVTGNAETTLCAQLLPLCFDDLRVEDCNLMIFKLGNEDTD